MGDKKLSATALTVFRAAERGETRLLLPAIVLAELYFANAKNRWFADFKTIYQDILSRQFFKFLPFDSRHVLDFDRDDLVPEMHDRIITGVGGPGDLAWVWQVATALLLPLALAGLFGRRRKR